MNVFIPIDPSWSYQFFEYNKVELSRFDFFHFVDTFYTCATQYITTHLNHRFGMTPVVYNECINKALSICNEYPTIADKIQQAFRNLYHIHRLAFNALQGDILQLQTVCDDTGLLTGIVFTINIRSV